MKTPYATFGRHLAALRFKAGYSTIKRFIEVYKDALGISDGYYYYERGNWAPPEPVLKKLAQIHNVSFEELRAACVPDDLSEAATPETKADEPSLESFTDEELLEELQKRGVECFVRYRSLRAA